MTAPEIIAAEWHAAWAALRLRLVALGDVLPREDEPFDLMLLWALRLR